MNKNSNSYQILYAAIMVLLVGTVLAFVYMALKPKQDENIANDKRRQILSAIHVAAANDGEVKTAYEKYITGDLLVDVEGNVADSAQNVAFDVDMKNNIKATDRKLPVFVATLDDGTKKYVIPVYGAGLWGPIWGYVAVNDDGKTIYGANFSHASETPGLGARITDDPAFPASFEGKTLFKDGAFRCVEVMKRGQKPTNDADYVDALSGATITSRGVSVMMEQCLTHYIAFFKKLQSETLNKDTSHDIEEK